MGIVVTCQPLYFITFCNGRVAISANEPATTAKLPKNFGRAKFNVQRGKSKRVKIKLKKAVRKRLKEKHSLKAYLVITMNGADGKPVTSSKRMKLKR